MRILLDTGVFIHSEFAQHAVRPTTVRWGNRKHGLPVHCTVRKPTDQNVEYQEQKEALFTVGRLIREGRVEAYDYSEIGFERLRGRKGFPICDALNGCSIHRCPPALERSRFKDHGFRGLYL